ncbi:MAG: hypothetical protein ACM3RP_09330 [Chitinophagales bacterium]
MRWLAALLALGAVALLLGSTLSSLRWRSSRLGPLKWAWLVLLSRALLCVPLVSLAVTAGRWPGLKATALWLALASLFTLFADILDRVWTYRTFRTRSDQPPPLT